MSSSSLPDFFPPFGMPIDHPLGCSWCDKEPEKKPNRPYYNMSLQDFEPYKALGEPLYLHGPAPYRPMLCGCNRYYVAKGMCVCSMDCRTKPLYAWVKANPEAFEAMQKTMQRWYHLSQIWWKQEQEAFDHWNSISRDAKFQFTCLQDEESPIECAHCEREGREYCRCECEYCGSKHCCGSCYDSDDDGYY